MWRRDGGGDYLAAELAANHDAAEAARAWTANLPAVPDTETVTAELLPLEPPQAPAALERPPVVPAGPDGAPLPVIYAPHATSVQVTVNHHNAKVAYHRGATTRGVTVGRNVAYGTTGGAVSFGHTPGALARLAAAARRHPALALILALAALLAAYLLFW